MRKFLLFFLFSCMYGGALAQDVPGPEKPELQGEAQKKDEGGQDIFAVLEEHGFDIEFLKDKDIIIVEKTVVDGKEKLVPRYVSHAHNGFFYKIFENNISIAVSALAFIISSPLLYNFFRSKNYSVLGDMCALMYTIIASGCGSYIVGKLSDIIIKKLSEDQKTKNNLEEKQGEQQDSPCKRALEN